MKRLFALIFLALITTFPLTPAAEQVLPELPDDIGSFLHSSCELEKLWVKLYGPENPLLPYVSLYRNLIGSYAKLCIRQPQKRTPVPGQDPAESMTHLLLGSGLQEVHDNALHLVTLYRDTTPTPTDTATTQTVPDNPAPAPAPQDQEATLQSVLTALQQLQLQNQQHPPQDFSHLKEQLALFCVGAAILALVTGAVKYRFSKYSRDLRQKVGVYQSEINQPHDNLHRAGIIEQLDCALLHIQKRPTT